MTLTGRKATAVVAALILSASLNVFGIAAWSAHELWPRGSSGSVRGMGRLLRSVPEDARPAVEQRFEAIRPEMGQRLDAIREARAEIGRLIADPSTDAATLEAAFADMRGQRDAIEALVHATLVEAAGEMPAEARAQWGEHWSARR